MESRVPVPPPIPPPAITPRWEYKVTTIEAKEYIHVTEKALNMLGDLGWELVSITQMGELHRLTLKRRKR